MIRQIDKATAYTGRDTDNTFSNFTGRKDVAQKVGYRQKQKTYVHTKAYVLSFTLNIYGDWTIFLGVGKGGCWGHLQGDLRVDGSGEGTFSQVEVDIFPTIYLVYGFFGYIHYFNFKYAHVLFIKIFAAIHNAWSISLDALSELWKFYQ